MYRAPLTVHVVWHPAFRRGDEYGRAVFTHLFEDPEDRTSHGLRIPVFHWRSTGRRSRNVPPPRELPLETAERAVVVPLLDDHFLATPGWDAFLKRTGRALRRRDDLLVPVCISPRARYGSRHAIDLARLPEPRRVPRLLSGLTYELCALLGRKRGVPAFVSYATADGECVAERVKTFLGEGKVDAFFAPRDLRPGRAWREELRREVRRSVLVAIRTDGYGSREWCQIEVLEAKRAGVPVVVLDALATRESRGFPYLGNAPVIRWRPRAGELVLEQLLGTLLREELRFRHFERRVERLAAFRGIVRDLHVQPAPPELLTSLAAPDKPLLVYPDPPLGSHELDLLRELRRNVEPVTPLMLLAS